MTTVHDVEQSVKDIRVAATKSGIMITDQFSNTALSTILNCIQQPKPGEKDGSYFLRATLRENEGKCLSRSNENLGEARLLIIDADKRILPSGVVIDGAPPPAAVSNALKKLNILHYLYGSYSHYTGELGNRYRILLITTAPYNEHELKSTIEDLICKINALLPDDLLHNAKENGTLSQPWYFPRRPADSTIESLYMEFLDGTFATPVQPHAQPKSEKKRSIDSSADTPINLFNKQNLITDLLKNYGYKFIYKSHDTERWLSPRSESGSGGIYIDLAKNKFYSHHGSCPFNDGFWHDAFDLLMTEGNLSFTDAVKHAARLTGLNNQSRTKPDPEPKTDGSAAETQNNDQPIPLPALPQVAKFDPEKMLPSSIRKYVKDIADRQQCPIDFVAVTATIGLATLLGNKAVIYPKKNDDWQVVPNLWGAIIGRPSAMKTPAMKAAIKPIDAIQKRLSKEFDEAQNEYKFNKEVADSALASARKKAINLMHDGKKNDAKKILEDAQFNEMEPHLKRIMVNDVSVEILGVLLSQNSNGLLHYRDELSGWLHKISREEFAQDRSFYLEAYDGAGTYSYDRISRQHIEISNMTLSIIGGIQPSKINPLIQNTISGSCDDGMIQRIQLAVWPDDYEPWKWTDKSPDQDAKLTYNHTFDFMHDLKFETSGSAEFKFCYDAQESFKNWMSNLQNEARGGDIHPAYESHLLKMPKTICALALIFEIVDQLSIGLPTLENPTVKAPSIATCIIKRASLDQALAWYDYLKSHAMRIYNSVMQPGLAGARLILVKLDKLPDEFVPRDVYRNQWSGLTVSSTVKDALEFLCDYHHLTAIESPSKIKGGQSITRYRKHPIYIKKNESDSNN